MSVFIYNLFVRLYRFGILLISPWNPKAKAWLAGRSQLFEKLAQVAVPDGSRVVWMHCASLGEFEQGRPLLEKVRQAYPHAFIFLSFFSSSGYDATRSYAGAHHIFYLPVDSARNASQLLDILRPSLVLWVKYEFWLHHLREISRRKIPLLLVSGIFRQDQAFFRFYGGLYRDMLSCFTHLFVQTKESATLLNSIGIHHFTVSGDTRFDRVVEIAGRFQPIAAVEAFCAGFPCVVAGSTWPEDEKELSHFANSHPDVRFIIAPHEIGAEHLNDLRRRFAHNVYYSTWARGDQGGDATQPANVLIVDNIGMLSRLYHYATVAYVGGGFGADGVHNVLEAAVYGKPVVFGPVYAKYIEARELVRAGGGIPVHNALELEQQLAVLLSRGKEFAHACAASQAYVGGNTGATLKIMAFIEQHRWPGASRENAS